MYLKPSNIFYSQHQISATFGNWNKHRNTTIGETLDDLCNGRCSISDIETIKVVKKDGKWCTIDNRRLWVFHHLQAARKCTQIPVCVVPYDSSSHGRKFSSTNGGKSVTIIKGRSPGGAWFKRLKPVIPTEIKEDEPSKPEREPIPNNQLKSEENKSTNSVSISICLEDIKKTEDTGSKNAKTKLKSLCQVSGTTFSTKCEPSTPSEKCNVTSSGSSVNRIVDVNADEMTKRMRHIWSGKPLCLLEPKQLNAKSHQDHRYKPYSFFRTIVSQRSKRHVWFPQQFGKKRGRDYFKSRNRKYFFEEEEEEEEEEEKEEDIENYSSSDNDWLDDDVAMFVDEREGNDGSEDGRIESDDNNDSKEIDYDDDPWSEEMSDDKSSEPEYDELDVWESEFDSHKIYHPLPDSDASDFEDDFLIAKELEHEEQKEIWLSGNLDSQDNRKSNYSLNDKLCLKTEQAATYSTNTDQTMTAETIKTKTVQPVSEVSDNLEDQAYVAEHKLETMSPHVPKIKKSNSLNGVHLESLQSSRTYCECDKSILTCSANDLSCLKHSTPACKTTDSPVSIRCTSQGNQDSLKSIAGSEDRIFPVTNEYSPSFSRTSTTQVTSYSCAGNSISVLNNSVAMVSSVLLTSNVSSTNNQSSSMNPSIAPAITGSINTDFSSSDESSVDTDWSYDEDSEDYSLSCHYGFFEKLEKKRRARKIAIKKYGCDLFDSDSD